MPIGPNTIDNLQATMTREEIVACWKDAHRQREEALERIREMEKELAGLRGRLFGMVSPTEAT